MPSRESMCNNFPDRIWCHQQTSILLGLSYNLTFKFQHNTAIASLPLIHDPVYPPPSWDQLVTSVKSLDRITCYTDKKKTLEHSGIHSGPYAEAMGSALCRILL